MRVLGHRRGLLTSAPSLCQGGRRNVGELGHNLGFGCVGGRGMHVELRGFLLDGQWYYVPREHEGENGSRESLCVIVGRITRWGRHHKWLYISPWVVARIWYSV